MRIIIPKYKSWLATAALALVLTAFFANGPLAAPMTKAEPEVIQQQTPAPGTLSIIAILIGLVERQVAIYVPSGYRAGTAVPLVFALHGGGGDASKMYAPDKRIVGYAESEGFIAVFPNGLPAPGAPAGSDKYYWIDPVNIGFMNHLIDLMTARFTINSRAGFISSVFPAARSSATDWPPTRPSQRALRPSPQWLAIWAASQPTRRPRRGRSLTLPLRAARRCRRCCCKAEKTRGCPRWAGSRMISLQSGVRSRRRWTVGGSSWAP